MAQESKTLAAPDSGPLPNKTTGEYPITKKDLIKQLRIQDVMVIGSIMATVLTGVFTGYFKVVHDARAESEIILKPLEARVNTLEQEQKHLRDDVHEVQLDLRELYKVIRENRRSARLEKSPEEE